MHYLHLQLKKLAESLRRQRLHLHQVVAVIYEDQAGQQAKSLDLLEGYPNYYDRKIVTLERDDETYDCWVYFMTLDKYKTSPPDSVYFDMVEQGYKDHGISNAQLYTALFESKENFKC